MLANKKQIQKKVNSPPVVLFTLFIFVKKKKAALFRAPFQKNFCLFLPFSEISVVGAPSGALWYQVGVSRKKKFFFSTYLIGVLKKQKKI